MTHTGLSGRGPNNARHEMVHFSCFNIKISCLGTLLITVVLQVLNQCIKCTPKSLNQSCVGIITFNER